MGIRIKEEHALYYIIDNLEHILTHTNVDHWGIIY